MPQSGQFKFIAKRVYVVTSVSLYAETGELKLWNQAVEENDGIDWGVVMQYYESLRQELAGTDDAWMLDLKAIKAKFKADADAGVLGKQFWGTRSTFGEAYAPILSHWQNAKRATGAPAIPARWMLTLSASNVPHPTCPPHVACLRRYQGVEAAQGAARRR